MPADKTSSRSRRYSSTLRENQAAETRTRVVAAAAELFGERGYAATSMPQIARAAGVSTETVQAHGPKQALLRAALDAFSFGGGSGTDARDTELGAVLLSVTSAHEAARVTAEVLTRVNAAVHGLWLAFSEAARGDDALAEAFRAYAAGIRAQNVVMMDEWAARGYLRDDVPLDELVDRAVLLGSVELYDRAIRVEGLTVEAYTRSFAAFIEDAVLAR